MKIINTLKLFIAITIIGTCHTNAQTLFEEDFENDTVMPASWITFDKDGDGYNWEFAEDQEGAHSGSKYVHSLSYDQVNAPLTPNNYLISPKIDLTNTDGLLELSWWVAPSANNPIYKEEHYKVLVSIGNSVDTSFKDNIFEETISQEQEGWEKRTVDISNYAEKNIYIAWVHFDCTDEDRLKLDDFIIERNASVIALHSDNIGLKVSPNPVSEFASLQFNLYSNTKVSYSINDIIGRTIYEENLGIINGFKKINIDTQKLSGGVYFIRMKHNSNISVVKFIKN